MRNKLTDFREKTSQIPKASFIHLNLLTWTSLTHMFKVFLANLWGFSIRKLIFIREYLISDIWVFPHKFTLLFSSLFFFFYPQYTSFEHFFFCLAWWVIYCHHYNHVNYEIWTHLPSAGMKCCNSNNLVTMAHRQHESITCITIQMKYHNHNIATLLLHHSLQCYYTDRKDNKNVLNSHFLSFFFFF